MELSHVLAFDIGGSHATAGMVDSESLTVRFSRSCAIDSMGAAESILNELQILGDAAIAEASQLGVTPNGIAIAVPGPFEYESGISRLRHKYSSLYGMDLRSDFEKRFGIAKDKIVFLNDAQAFLLGEGRAGTAKGVGRCIGLTLGTGVGSAFSIGGDIVSQGIGVPPGGEIYCLPWKGRTVEDTISTRAIQASYRRLSGKNMSVREICSTPHDHIAKLVMYEFGENLGMVLKDLCLRFCPEAVVLGGAISQSAGLFLESAIASLGKRSDRHFLRTCMHVDHAPLVGSAVRCLQTLELQT
jgi:glucokinase